MNISILNPALSFIIPTHNRAARLVTTLSRLVALPGPDAEIVVVDNGSSDDTVDAVHAVDSAITLITLPENKGAVARNDGARAAHGRILFMLDDDSCPAPGAVERALACLEDHRVGLAGCLVRLADGTYEEGGAPYVPIGCGMALRRETFEKLGGFCEIYETYVEEYDLAFRALSDGYDVVYEEGAVVHHEPSRDGPTDFLVRQLARNNIYLAHKFFDEKDAERFSSWVLERYGRFARRQGLTKGFDEAVVALEEMRTKGLRDRFVLSDRAMAYAAPWNVAARAIDALEAGNGRIAFLRAGKEIIYLIEAARQRGMHVEAVYDEGLWSPGEEIAGVTVRSLDDVASFDGCLLCGGLTPGFKRNTQALAARLGKVLGDG
ncbi:MAG: glycosyltransferase family 2 protein [Deltaproteobacteria bacterium]|nr:glycosyltransferase family 2 protein [Deltaproteobacteria bacterium]